MEPTHFERAVQFITSIGIEVKYRPLDDDTFLPGLLIDEGCICIDLDKLKYPGDILHEAGHVAVVPANDRKQLNGATIADRKDRAAEEMMAIAWSFAACKHLGIDPYFVFHETGYKDNGKAIADQFEAGNYFGVPMLQFSGMSAEPKMAETLNLPAFPAMAKWLREA
jgi:hypothetical protein